MAIGCTPQDIGRCRCSRHAGMCLGSSRRMVSNRTRHTLFPFCFSDADMLFKVDEIIAYVSRFFTLKIGDLLFTGTPVGVGPVSVGQHLQGYLEEEKLLDFYVR